MPYTLPTLRVSFEKQQAILRGYGSIGGTDPISNLDVANIVKIAPPSVSLTNTFFAECGLLTQGARYRYARTPATVVRYDRWKKVAVVEEVDPTSGSGSV